MAKLQILCVVFLVALHCAAADYPMWKLLQDKYPHLSKYIPKKEDMNFLVMNSGKDIFIPNQKRTKEPALLKLSINGVTVDKVINRRPNQYTWLLSDKTEVLVSMSPPSRDPKSVQRYSIWVPGTSEHRELCIHYGYRNASWFAGYESLHPSWPMDTSRALPREDFANVRNFSSDTFGDASRDFHLVMEQLFVNTDGFAVALDAKQPLFMRRDPAHQGEPVLCFSTNNSIPYSVKETDASYRALKVHIFAGANIRTVTDFMVASSGMIPKPKEIPDEARFTHPTFSSEAQAFPTIGRTHVMALADQIVAHGFSAHSEIMIDDYLQREQGNMELNEKHYPKVKEMIAELHAKGFRVGMAASPSSSKFRKNMKHDDPSTADFFIKYYGEKDVTTMIDFSNPEACNWYEYLLRHAKYEYGIDSFQLSATSIRWFMGFKDPLVHKFPGMISTMYVETAARMGNKIVTDEAYKTQHLPVFVRFHRRRYDNAYLDQLQTLIPNALAVSMAGYSFFVPYQIGGFARETQPLEELYLRWVQAVTFMPSMRFLHTPWSYPHKNVTEITKKFVDLHAAHAPTLIALAKERVHSGSPIIRPLWYVAPDDAATYRINDQFMVGNDILVAPVLKLGQRERSVYLPSGVWVDQHGAKFNGGSWAKIQVPVEELPYFKRQV